MKNIHHHKDKKFVNNVFDSVYENYDLMNDIMSFGSHRLWKKEFINSLDLKMNQKVIDMASGTGDIAHLILKKNKNQKIYRIEPNFNMLNHNISKFDDYEGVHHICSYGENIPLESQVIDAYLISFGLRNVSKIDNVLREAFRILKKGGGFFCLEFYKINKPVLGKLYKLYSKAIPFFGKIFNKNSNPYEYLVQSIEDFHSQTVIENKLYKAGFKNVNIKNIFGGVASIHYAWKLND
tara:strand:- start:68 stop:778 length:711 start_codon:yes stop_codon:yes gene_type:complete